MSREPALGAVQPAQRVGLLDVLRGFAIFGILLVNVHFYSRPIYAVFTPPGGAQGAADRIVQALTTFLVAEKFFSILSVLFGIGAAIFFDRAAARGVSAVPPYLRRLLALFAVGITHALALYSGDFIGNYALLGLVLLAFVKVRGPLLLASSAAVLLAPCLLMAPSPFPSAPAPPPATAAAPAPAPATAQPASPSPPAQPPAAADAGPSRQERRRLALERRIQESVRVYGRGSVAEIFRHRAREVRLQYGSLPFVGWKMVAMFLLGMWCWRSGLVGALDRRRAFVRRVTWIALAVGLAGNGLAAWGEHAGPAAPASLPFLAFVGQQVGAPGLAIFYMAVVARLHARGAAPRAFDGLAAVGRMAMSNYVFQSLVCTTIFYSYGLGLFGKTGTVTNLALALALFALQVVLSRAWLRRHAFGPLEWLVRWFVYLGRPAPVPAPAAAAGVPR